MDSYENKRRGLGLRPRFLISAALLVVTTVVVSLWTLGALSRLSGAVSETLRQNDEATAATAQVASAIEREDDALLLVLTGDTTAEKKLKDARTIVDQRFLHLDEVLNEPPEQELVDGLGRAIESYRGAADLVAGEVPGSLVRYHREVNPLLRQAVGFTTQLRDRHFEATQRMVNMARDEVARAREVVLGISLGALLISVLLALHLAGRVIVPLTEMTRRARAIATEDFEARLTVASNDELGDLAHAFNEMAEHLEAFRRSNFDEVLKAKATLEATLQALPDAVILLSEKHEILSMNRRAEEVVARGIDLGALLDGTNPPAKTEGADLSAALRVDIHGASRRLLPRAVPVLDANQLGDGTILVLYDVTELARLDEMRLELIAVASHELHTPLTTLRMSLLMLEERSASLPTHERELVTTCLLGVQQLAETIDEFLDLTRIEAGKLRLVREPVAVGAFLERIADRWRPRTEDRGIALEVDAKDALVDADSRRLSVVLDNLLSNALKYTPSGGRISIRAQHTNGDGAAGRAVRISVDDSGPGVPEEFRRRIFEKFFRVEHHRPGTDQGTRGVGIGLYLCREIVTLHDGRIWCEPGERGSGARLVFEIPEVQVLSPEMQGREAADVMHVS